MNCGGEFAFEACFDAASDAAPFQEGARVFDGPGRRGLGAEHGGEWRAFGFRCGGEGFGDEGRAFARAQITIGRFARFFGVSERPEQVVAKLKRETEWRREGVHRRELRLGRPAQDRPEEKRTPYGVAARLQSPDERDVARADHVEVLSEDDIFMKLGKRACGVVEVCEMRAPKELPRVRGSEVAGEHRDGIGDVDVGEVRAERCVRRWAAAAYVVAVHPVVVNEQVGLQKFEGCAREHARPEVNVAARARVARREERATKALSAAHRKGVELVNERAESRVDTPRTFGLLREELAQCVFDAKPVVDEPRRHAAQDAVKRWGMSAEISGRKNDHLDLCATEDVSFRDRTTLLEDVRLTHQALPELSLDDVDTSLVLFGKRLRAPIFVASMTGGSERAGEVNLALAKIAEKRGYGFGLGSQRAMQKRPETAASYAIRGVAPTALVLGNIGIVQAREWDTGVVASMLREVGADGLFLHMNPAMELVQPGGDRDFRGGAETMARYVRELDLPVVAKETGCGVSFETAQKLREAGVRYVDVSGAGGTSWVGVETLRAKGGERDLGDALWDWGIPTAASVAYVRRAGLSAIATGGIQSGLDVARAIALGAKAAGIARPALVAFYEGGEAAVERLFDRVEAELRAVMLLTGSRTLADLERAPKVVRGELREYMGA